jgi:hypothetical protein
MAKFEVGDYFTITGSSIYQISAVDIALDGEISYQVVGISGWYEQTTHWVKLSPQEVAHYFAEQICEEIPL